MLYIKYLHTLVHTTHFFEKCKNNHKAAIYKRTDKIKVKGNC